MLTARIPSLGELTILLDTMAYADGLLHLFCPNINGVIHCSTISWQDDFIYEYGWAHIVGYTIDGVTTSCDYCTSIG